MARHGGTGWWRWCGWLLAAIALAGVLAAAAAGPAAARAKPVKTTPVPQGFVGVDADGPLFNPPPAVDLDDQLGTMVTNGVESIRVAFNWAAAQPYAAASDVPAADQPEFTDAGGVPTDFQQTDAVVGAAARHHISVLPTVLYAPSWDARRNDSRYGGFATPARPAPYAAYLTALVGRYGPHGSFWAANPSIPRMPIREWQIWNEPNIGRYWPPPFAPGYVDLLRASHAAIKRADPGAKVVLGALTNTAWSALKSIYRVPGARGLFDVVSVNAFTKLPANVMRYLQFVRSTMNHYGDRTKPLLATELSWPSALGQTTVHYDFDTTEAGQARNIATLLPLIGRDRVALRLAGFDYYTWLGQDAPGNADFEFAGLLTVTTTGTVTAKPALAAFRTGALALEGCRAKGSLATSCIR